MNAPLPAFSDTTGDGGEVRRAAAVTVAAVIADGARLDEALERAAAPFRQAADRALLAELCYGTLRWYPALQFLLDRLLRRPLPPHEQRLRALLLTGLYQLVYLRTPGYAAVSSSVAAARLLDRTRATGLVNAVLRGFQRRRDELLTALAAAPAADAHPGWLRRRLRRDWPERWREIIDANNQRAPLTLRVNRLRGDRAGYLRRLDAAGLEIRQDRPVAGGEMAVSLAAPCPVDRLPGFHDGLVSVQDAAAQLAAPLLAPRRGERLLDACAAPGGKTGHLRELAPDAELLALDSDPRRLERVHANLDRLGLGAGATLHAADAARPEDWWDGRPFDAILLDAPCSGSGVIRRHPDIKLRRRPADIAAAAAQQRRLLDGLWPLLRPGGRLLYATCSVLSDENDAVIDAFLADHDDLIGAPERRRLLPGADGDGFFYALLRRAAT